MLDFEVIPENSLSNEQWEFILGMHFSQSVNVIQEQVGVIRDVHVNYNDQDPLLHDLVINLTNDGIRLVFDPDSQLLKLIEVYDMRKVKLRYGDAVFNSAHVAPSIEQVDHIFGATHPGIYDSANGLFLLSFRGLSFYFSVEPKFEPKFARGLGSLQFSGGGSPQVSKMLIYSGASLQKIQAPDMPLSCRRDQLLTDHCDVIRSNDVTHGIRLQISLACLSVEGDSGASKPVVCEVRFGASCQEVASILGAPTRVFYKSEDKMKIHSRSAHKRALSRCSDYFFNYFSLGLDVLFDAKTNCVRKIVLHTNYPGHYNFNIYHRCRFSLVVRGSGVTKPIEITSLTRWDSVCDSLQASVRPVVLNRASSTNTYNPFGSTLCYGVQDFICEVMPNGHLASVILYQPLKTTL